MQLDKENIPQHIAIIMDGNGRWAKKHFMPRSMGHKAGVKAVERTLEAAGKVGVKYLTLYAFSTENWKRPKEEVNALMHLLAVALDKNLKKLQQNKIALKIIGDYKKLPETVVQKLEKVVEETAENSTVTLVLALNYSGQWEIAHAAKSIAEKVKAGEIDAQQIDVAFFNSQLMTCFMPPPDLVIRTSGEQRISNFLLWQSAYSELYFTEKFWPDFDENTFFEAIKTYQSRDRRFGGIK